MVGRSWRSWLSERDPDSGDLRKALRTAIVLPLPFAYGLEVLGNEIFALFAGFGVFAMLSFADFGGPLPKRARAYLVFALAGAGIVAIGTLTSQSTVLAAVGSLAVILLVQQVAVFGGYWASATIPATLAFVLAVMIPTPASQLLPQVAGWVVAGVLCALAAVVAWPRRTRRQVAGRAADVTDRLAALLSRWERDPSAPELTGEIDALVSAVRRLMSTWDVFRSRPGGPAVRDQALIYLVDQVRQLVVFARALVADSEDSLSAAEHSDLVVAAVEAMRGTSALLRGGPDTLDLRGLASTRAADLDDVTEGVAQAMAAGQGEDAVQRAGRSFAVRMLVHATLSMAANARLMAGGDVDDVRGFVPPPTVPEAGSSTAWQRGLRILRVHLSLRSAWSRNTLRAAVAITVAVVVARTIEVEHGFWVALGTLSVLRSSAAGTAANALQAVAGTVIGFVVTVPVLLLVGDDTAVLWVLLPLTTFLSAWTPRVVHFVVGQASFTLFVVVLFNLVDPVGWETGLVRLEDIALGVIVAVGVGIVLWPRGVVAQVGAVVGAAYLTVAAYVTSSFSLTVPGAAEASTPAEVEGARQRAFASIAEADEAVMLARTESRAEALPNEDMDRLVIGLARLRHTGDALGWVHSGLPPLSGCDGTAAALGELAGSSSEATVALGEDISHGRSPEAPPPAATSVADVLSMLAEETCAPSRELEATTVVGMVFAARWFQVDEQVLDLVRGSASALADLQSRPWWR